MSVVLLTPFHDDPGGATCTRGLPSIGDDIGGEVYQNRNCLIIDQLRNRSLVPSREVFGHGFVVDDHPCHNSKVHPRARRLDRRDSDAHSALVIESVVVEAAVAGADGYGSARRVGWRFGQRHLLGIPVGEIVSGPRRGRSWAEAAEATPDAVAATRPLG